MSNGKTTQPNMKKQKFSKVQKRSTYSEMKESNEKTKTFVIMLKNNPEILEYFTKKNILTRTPEVAHIVIMTEQYARKEHLRSPLYSLVEKYRGDNEFKYASAEKEIKKLIQDSIAFIKNENSSEYAAVLKVLENVEKKELDTSKVFKNKEWYRALIKTLGAMGLGAYLATSAFMAVPETKPEPVVENVIVKDESCEKSLDLCLKSLNGKPATVVRTPRICPKPNEEEICKLYASEITELKKLLKDGEASLIAKLNALEKELENERNKDHNTNLKLHLLKKLDEKFEVTDKDGYNTLYKAYRNVWKNRLEKNDASAYVTLIMLGDYFMVPDMKEGIVQGLYGHGQRMPNGKIADIRDAISEGNYVYIAGVWYKNDMPGTTKAFKNVIENIYDFYKSKYGTGPWDGKLE